MKIYSDIYSVVNKVPHGKLVSYGAVAQAAGLFRGARLVGWALKALPPDTQVPWHRVINKQARISIINPRIPAQRQKELLEEEGIVIKEIEGNFQVENADWFEF